MFNFLDALSMLNNEEVETKLGLDFNAMTNENWEHDLFFYAEVLLGHLNGACNNL